MAVFMVEVVEEEEDKPRAQQLDYQALAVLAEVAQVVLALQELQLLVELTLAVAAEAVV
jgi:hypothetical protein